MAAEDGYIALNELDDAVVLGVLKTDALVARPVHNLPEVRRPPEVRYLCTTM